MKSVEELLNVITDLSAEAIMSIDENEPQNARELLASLLKYIDTFMTNNNLEQVTEASDHFDSYMSNAYFNLNKKG